jgi:transcriptional regulator with XRE-family HTH domain
MQMDDPGITGAQLRAGRALLNWSVRELSIRSGVSESAISRAEKSNGLLSMHVRTSNTIQRTFQEHGINFLGKNGVWITGEQDDGPQAIMPNSDLRGARSGCAKRATTGASMIITVYIAAAVVMAVGSLYLAWQYLDYRKFLAGAFFVSSGVSGPPQTPPLDHNDRTGQTWC